MTQFICSIIILLNSLLLITPLLGGDHRVNKYFTTFEQTDQYSYTRTPRLFMSNFIGISDTAFARNNGHSIGVSELPGFYDLQNTINSVGTIYGDSLAESLRQQVGSKFASVPLPFSTGGRSFANGFSLKLDYPLGIESLIAGFQIPFARTVGSVCYEFNTTAFLLYAQSLNVPVTPTENYKMSTIADGVRRNTHDIMQLYVNDWKQNTFGDLDLYLRWNYFVDHQFFVRSFNLNVQVGMTLPTSQLLKIDHPAAVPFANNGHTGIYYSAVPEFELKQDLKAGCIFTGIFLFKKNNTIRIATYNEPSIFSALTAKVETHPGATAHISPYITFENLIDGLNFQARYSYTRHAKDTIYDLRNDKTISSYLSKQPDSSHSKDVLDKNILYKEYLSSWRSHYLTFTVSYNTKEALQKTLFSPTFYTEYKMPLGGRGISNNYLIGFGMALNF